MSIKRVKVRRSLPVGHHAWRLIIPRPKHTQKWITFYGTEEQALLEEERLRALARTSTYHQSLRRWTLEWLDRIVEPSVSTQTYAAYSSSMRRHTLPVLGNIALRDLTPWKVEEFYQSLKGATNSRVLHQAVLRVCLNAAVRKGLLWENPAELAQFPDGRTLHLYLRCGWCRELRKRAHMRRFEEDWVCSKTCEYALVHTFNHTRQEEKQWLRRAQLRLQQLRKQLREPQCQSV